MELTQWCQFLHSSCVLTLFIREINGCIYSLWSTQLRRSPWRLQRDCWKSLTHRSTFNSKEIRHEMRADYGHNISMAAAAMVPATAIGMWGPEHSNSSGTVGEYTGSHSPNYIFHCSLCFKTDIFSQPSANVGMSSYKMQYGESKMGQLSICYFYSMGK